MNSECKIMVTLLSLFPLTGMGATYLNGEDVRYRHDGVTAGVGLGFLGAKAQEFVYSEKGRQISRLDWKTNNAAIINAEINYDVYSWLSINARGWTSLASAGSHLTDRDWQNPNSSQYTDSSDSPSKLNYANEFDLSVRGWFLNNDNAKAGIVAGYQQSRYSWTAFGGQYDYAGSDSQGNYRPDLPRDKGNFPHKNTVGYKQTLSAPYIGLVGNYSYRDFEFGTTLKYSPFAVSKDNDSHYLNGTTSKVNADRGDLWSALVQAGYYVSTSTKIYTEASYTLFDRNRGDIRQWNKGEYQFGRNMGGIENRSWMLSAGVRYNF